MKIKRSHAVRVLLSLVIGILIFGAAVGRYTMEVVKMVKGKKTVVERLEQYGDKVRGRLAGDFERVGVMYPPASIVLVGLKQERQLEVWVSSDNVVYRLLRTYPVLGASGAIGPKLKEGDKQVPEGVYRIESLNPNSTYHLALRVDYPNSFDKSMAKLDGRTVLGGDIMIHGKSCSIGCLAMGDAAAEDLFVLAAETGIENVSVIISPVDFRIRDLPPTLPAGPDWTDKLYAGIRQELCKLTDVTGSVP